MNRILYSMCYDMLAQEHSAYKAQGGLAISCPGTATWLWLAPKQDAQDFFTGFLAQNTAPISGIVAERELALTCAEFCGEPFSRKEIVSYFLPREAKLPVAAASGGLRSPTPAEMPLVIEWVRDFYTETFQMEMPENLSSATTKKNLDVSVWHDDCPCAMGSLTGAGETSRMNLVYVPPRFRGKGYGRAVVCALAAKARESSRLPTLYTAADNAAANKLYASLGFKEAGRLLEVRF